MEAISPGVPTERATTCHFFYQPDVRTGRRKKSVPSERLVGSKMPKNLLRFVGTFGGRELDIRNFTKKNSCASSAVGVYSVAGFKKCCSIFSTDARKRFKVMGLSKWSMV
jgi:hypothetical protein